MGHMGNGAYGPWGLWAMGPMGPMGDLDIFANNFINTGWILTKILLDIDINVFYLNYRAIFPWWLHLSHIFDGFQILSALCFLLRSPSLAMWESRHMTDDVIIGNFSVTINRTEQEGGSRWPFWSHFEISNPYYSALSLYFKMPFWLIIDINGPYPQ